MVDKIAEIISNRIIAVNGQGEDKEIYTYGLQILLNTLLSIGVVLLIGSAANELWGTVIFLFCYCSLRLFAGGLHVDTNNKCMSIFVGGYILVLCILKCVDITLKIDVIAILVLFNICILMWAPVDVPNNDFGESGPFFVLKSTATGACCQHMRELLVKLAKEIA